MFPSIKVFITRGAENDFCLRQSLPDFILALRNELQCLSVDDSSLLLRLTI